MLGKECSILQCNKFYKKLQIKDLEKRVASMMPIYNYIIKELKKLRIKTVIDIGCGTGDFLSVCRDNGILGYGFDFSSVAIEICRDHYKLDNVWIGDALDKENYKDEYDSYLAIEVLEHIMQDLDMIRNIRLGFLFIFSLPNWIGNDSHVRCFKSDDQIKARYDKVVDIKNVMRFRANQNQERRVVISTTKIQVKQNES